MGGEHFDTATGRPYYRYLWSELSIREQSYFRAELLRAGRWQQRESFVYEIYIDGSYKGISS